MQIQNPKRFYVYEHLRVDNGSIFYVGKGTGHRSRVASKYHRNPFWINTTASAGGFTVRMVAENLPEDLAFLVEIERIDQLRKMGVRLCNLTDGGDGTSGWVKTPEWREKVGKAHRGKVISQEVRDKISRSVRSTGYRHSEDARKRMSTARMGHKNNVGRKQPEAERIKRAESLMGNKSRTGQKRSDYERSAVSAALKGRKQAVLVCPHCGKNGGNAMRRHHFDHCPQLVTK
jgi:hypothetical protein